MITSKISPGAACVKAVLYTAHTGIAVGFRVWKIPNLNCFPCCQMSCLFSEQQALFLLASLNRAIEVVIRNTNRFFIAMEFSSVLTPKSLWTKTELLWTEHRSLRQNQQAARESGCNTKAAFLKNKSTFHVVGKQTVTKVGELMASW